MLRHSTKRSGGIVDSDVCAAGNSRNVASKHESGIEKWTLQRDARIRDMPRSVRWGAVNDAHEIGFEEIAIHSSRRLEFYMDK